MPRQRIRPAPRKPGSLLRLVLVILFLLFFVIAPSFVGLVSRPSTSGGSPVVPATPQQTR